MKKVLKLAINLAIFLLIIGFAWYMASSMKDNSSEFRNVELDEPFDSPYSQITAFELPEDIIRFELYDNKLYASAGQIVYILDTQGNHLGSFSVGADVRDITVWNEEVFLLYPDHVNVHHSTDGRLLRQWEAFSSISDFVSITVAGNAIFITDAGNKNICKLTVEGYFVDYIRSPRGFIIPSYTFDIDSWNDTIYCVNSGRHQIETYTLDGDYIASFGSHGGTAGYFAGCCNPVYISFTPDGELITSEKGNPRVGVFDRSGQFKELWFNNRMLGIGADARQVKATNEKIFVAIRNKITVFAERN